MRRVGEVMGEVEEGTGSLTLGSKTVGCVYCGAGPVPAYSEPGGKVVWWHPPTECCAKRRAVQVGPNRQADAEEPSNLGSW